MKYVLLILPLLSFCVDPKEIEFHHTHDEVTISFHDFITTNKSTTDLAAITVPTEQITITMPDYPHVDTTSPTMASPEWATLTRKQRIRQLCVNNKTAIIVGVATVSSATIAGIVALIVHFTAA